MLHSLGSLQSQRIQVTEHRDCIDENTFQVFQDIVKILKSETVTQQTCQLPVIQQTCQTPRTHQTSLRTKQSDQQFARTSNIPVLWSCYNLFCYRFISFWLRWAFVLMQRCTACCSSLFVIILSECISEWEIWLYDGTLSKRGVLFKNQ